MDRGPQKGQPQEQTRNMIGMYYKAYLGASTFHYVPTLFLEFPVGDPPQSPLRGVPERHGSAHLCRTRWAQQVAATCRRWSRPDALDFIHCTCVYGCFSKLGVLLVVGLMIRALLFGSLHWGPQVLETPVYIEKEREKARETEREREREMCVYI